VNIFFKFINFDVINLNCREKATLDIGTRIILESEQLLSKTHNDRISSTDDENQELQAKFLPGRYKRIQSINDEM
jgi:hypothetical protein